MPYRKSSLSIPLEDGLLNLEIGVSTSKISCRDLKLFVKHRHATGVQEIVMSLASESELDSIISTLENLKEEYHKLKDR